MYRVICVGLPKTGTQSLRAALEELGYVVLYNSHKYWQRWATGEYDLEVYGKEWMALIHFAPRHYPILHKLYPQAVFILNTRDKAEWLKSCEKWFSRKGVAGEGMRLVRNLIFGVPYFVESQFSKVYDEHYGYFPKWAEANGVKWLEYDVKQGWEPLCEFLRMQVPDKPFPWLNNRLHKVAKVKTR